MALILQISWFFCSYAAEAQNSQLVMIAARHFWNAILPLITQPIERDLLQEPISVLIDCISEVSDKEPSEKGADVSSIKASFLMWPSVQGVTKPVLRDPGCTKQCCLVESCLCHCHDHRCWHYCRH